MLMLMLMLMPVPVPMLYADANALGCFRLERLRADREERTKE